MSAKDLPKTIGRYQVVRHLGAGAMGRVLLARDPVLEREVAIKVLRSDLAVGSDVRDSLLVRMRHEARAAARVTHPNLVVLHDMGEDDALGLYLVFEYLEGPTLRQRIAERRLSARTAAKLARELGSALTFAHEKGVLHRDVKPDNVVLTPTGAKIADFGIARIPDSTLTGAGGLLGTPAYSAPETFHGGKFSPASDQFSLAATLYEAISGSRAFPGDDAIGVATKIVNERPDRVASRLGYSPEIDTVLERAMAKLPADRFETCEAFSRALAAALVSEPSTKSLVARAVDTADAPASTARALPTVSERKPWRVLLGGVGVVLISALLVRAFLKNRESSAAPMPEASLTGERETPSASAAKRLPVPSRAHQGSEEPRPLPSSIATQSSPSEPSSSPSVPAASASAPSP